MKSHGTGILFILITFMLVEPVSAGYYQELYYAGMSCSRIQKDSIAHPANEIFINIYVRNNRGRVFKSRLPSNGRLYKNVKPGYRANRPLKMLWRGRPQNLLLMALMWENDDGGKTVDILSQYLAAYVEGKAVGGAVPPGQEISGVEDPFATLIAKGYKHLLGTDNDLIGYSRIRLAKNNWSSLRLNRYKNIRYHFATVHRKGGANCRTYFRFKRGGYYKENVKKKISRMPDSRRSVPQQQRVVNQRDCNAVYNRCAEKIRRCKSAVKHHNDKVRRCSRHGGRQYSECMRYYTSGTRRQRYRHSDAESICTSKLKAYQQRCPQKKYDRCGAYSICDSNTRVCQQANKSQHVPQTRMPENTPAPYVKRQYTPVSPYRKSLSQGRMVTFNIINNCGQLSSVAIHYTKGGKYLTKGWFPAYLDRKSTFKAYVYGNDLYVYSNWGKVKDSRNRQQYKQLYIKNSAFSYSGKKHLGNKKW